MTCSALVIKTDSRIILTIKILLVNYLDNKKNLYQDILLSHIVDVGI